MQLITNLIVIMQLVTGITPYAVMDCMIITGHGAWVGSQGRAAVALRANGG